MFRKRKPVVVAEMRCCVGHNFGVRIEAGSRFKGLVTHVFGFLELWMVEDIQAWIDFADIVGGVSQIIFLLHQDLACSQVRVVMGTVPGWRSGLDALDGLNESTGAAICRYL